ncbi:MAG TPA: YihY/virulence factor BrkB family protein [Thermomicrobiales bacterium]|nr:YihY/virulence factor BrkB family protein [Thermomicrobiales bacterium]
MRPARRHHRALRRARRGLWAIPRWMIRGYNEANAGDLAAAIAFNALVAMVPVALLMVALAGLLFRSDQVLRMALLASVWALPGRSASEALDTVLQAKRNSGIFGLLSLLGFTWIGANFVASLGRGMNRIYGVRNRRFVHERLRGLVVIVVLSCLLGLAAIAAVLPTLFIKQDVRTYFEQWIFNTTSVQFLSYGLALLAAFILFATIYRVVPNAGQRTLDILPGAVVAALLFVLLVQAFPLYIRFVRQGNLYGQALLLISLFVSWFYLMAHVLLFGTYVNATWQHYRQCRGRRRSLFPFRLPTGKIRWLSRREAQDRGIPVGSDPCEDPRPHVDGDQIA